MKFRQFTWIVFYFLGIILFILHGLGENRVHFKVEVISSNLLDNFLKRPDLTPAIRKKTVSILKELDQLSKKTPIKQLQNGIITMDSSETALSHFAV